MGTYTDIYKEKLALLDGDAKLTKSEEDEIMRELRDLKFEIEDTIRDCEFSIEDYDEDSKAYLKKAKMGVVAVTGTAVLTIALTILKGKFPDVDTLSVVGNIAPYTVGVSTIFSAVMGIMSGIASYLSEGAKQHIEYLKKQQTEIAFADLSSFWKRHEKIVAEEKLKEKKERERRKRNKEERKRRKGLIIENYDDSNEK